MEILFLYHSNFTVTTVCLKKYAHGFVVLCFVVVMQSFIMNSHEVFIHIHQGCFAGTGAIVRLPQCQWSKPDGYGKISQCITTTKHSKAKTVCIFLGIYCIMISIIHVTFAFVTQEWKYRDDTSVGTSSYPEPVYTGESSVHWNATGMPLVDPVYSGIPLGDPANICRVHWYTTGKTKFESAPHWNATG